MSNDTENMNEIDTGEVNSTESSQELDTASQESQSTDTGAESKSTPQAESQRGADQNYIPHSRFNEVNEEKKYWRQRAMELEQRQQQAAQPQAEKQASEPRPEDFPENPLAFIEAKAAYIAEKKFTEFHQKQQEQQAQYNQQQEAQRAAQQWQSASAEAAAKYPDFYDVLANSPAASIPMPPPVLKAFMTTKAGAEAAYYLGKNPQEALRISQMDPNTALMEVGMITARLATGQGQAQKQPVSKAPKPISPVGSGKTRVPASYSDDMSQEDFNAAFPPMW